jgi:hypothetical protein
MSPVAQGDLLQAVTLLAGIIRLYIIKEDAPADGLLLKKKQVLAA